MIHSLPGKQAGGDETIESLEILTYNDFVTVSSHIGYGYICVHIRKASDRHDPTYPSGPH